jgi:hypothetical protein
VRIVAVFHLMQLGPAARSALGAIEDALHDPDERVRKAAEIAIAYFKTKPEPNRICFFF